MIEGHSVSIGADEAGNRIGDHIAEAEERVQEAARLAEQMSALRRTSHSRDGAVSVTVDVAGRVTALEIQSFAMLGSPSALASTILSCITDAQAQAGRGFVEAAAAVWGSESELAEKVRQAVGVDRPSSRPGGLPGGPGSRPVAPESRASAWDIGPAGRRRHPWSS